MQLPRVSGDGIGCVGVGCDDVVKEYRCKSFIPIVWNRIVTIKIPDYLFHLHSFPNTESAVLSERHNITWRIRKRQHCSAVSLSYHCRNQYVPQPSYNLFMLLGCCIYQISGYCWWCTYLNTVHTWMLYIPVYCTYLDAVHTCMLYIPGCCPYLDAVHTWMLYIPVCCTYTPL